MHEAGCGVANRGDSIDTDQYVRTATRQISIVRHDTQYRSVAINGIPILVHRYQNVIKYPANNRSHTLSELLCLL